MRAASFSAIILTVGDQLHKDGIVTVAPKKRIDWGLILSDTHFGSTVAVCGEEVALEDGGVYQLSKTQGWLLERWREIEIEWLSKRAQGGGKKWLIHSGDFIDGIHHESVQLVKHTEIGQLEIGFDLMQKNRDAADFFFQVVGTEPTHTGNGAQFEEKVGKDLHGEYDHDNRRFSWYHLPLEINGKFLDIAHHPPGNPVLPWTRPTAALKLSMVTRMEYLDAGDFPPDLVVRGHIHRYSDSGPATETRAIICPAFQGATAYINRRNPGGLSHIGAVLFCIKDQRLDIFPYWWKSPRRERVRPDFPVK